MNNCSHYWLYISSILICFYIIVGLFRNPFFLPTWIKKFCTTAFLRELYMKRDSWARNPILLPHLSCHSSTCPPLFLPLSHLSCFLCTPWHFCPPCYPLLLWLPLLCQSFNSFFVLTFFFCPLLPPPLLLGSSGSGTSPHHHLLLSPTSLITAMSESPPLKGHYLHLPGLASILATFLPLLHHLYHPLLDTPGSNTFQLLL